MQTCKTCNITKPFTDFATRQWKTSKGEAREGYRKVCYECQREIDNARYNAPVSRKRDWKRLYDALHAEERQEYREKYYAENRERWTDRENGWRHSDRAKAYDATYEARPEVREAAKMRGHRWRQANKPRLVVKTRARQAKVARATPAWADLDAILALYELAAQMTKETGIRHEVDHYFPLVSEVVCGLHVHFNLRIITGAENRSKANRMPE